MPHIPFHPAIGFGDLMDGWFVVPQNPIRDAGTPLVPSLQATAPNRVLRKARLAELMPGQFTVPQNPLMMALSGGVSGCGGGMGCGCSSCGGGSANYTLNGLRGMGDWSQIAPMEAWPSNYNSGGWNMFQSYGGPGTYLSGLGQLDTSSLGNFVSSVPTWLNEPSPIFSGVSNWLFWGGLIVGLDLYMKSWPRWKRGRQEMMHGLGDPVILGGTTVTVSPSGTDVYTDASGNVITPATDNTTWYVIGGLAVILFFLYWPSK